MRCVSLAACVAVLSVTSTAHAVEDFVGRWAIDPAACTGLAGTTAATAALVATETDVRWFPGTCRIGKMYKLGQAVYIQARCFGDSASDIPITLDARGDRLRVTWNKAKTEELRRCK